MKVRGFNESIKTKTKQNNLKLLISCTISRAHSGEHLKYYALHRPNEFVECFENLF